MGNAITIDELRKEIAKFNEERDWQKYHTPKNLALSISIEAAELLEHFQWLNDAEVENYLQDPKKVREVAAEIADVILYSLNLSSRLNIDITKALLEKIDENKRKYPVDKVKGNYKIRRNQITPQLWKCAPHSRIRMDTVDVPNGIGFGGRLIGEPCSLHLLALLFSPRRDGFGWLLNG